MLASTLSDEAPKTNWPIQWRPVTSFERVCHSPGSDVGNVVVIQKAVGPLDYLETVRKSDGDLVAFCIKDSRTGRVLITGDGKTDYGIAPGGSDRQIVVYNAGLGYSAILDVRGEVFSTPLRPGPTRPHIKTTWDGPLATLIADWSDRGGGLDTYPLAPSGTAVATHWRGAELFGQSADDFYAWDVCGRRHLTLTSPTSTSPPQTVGCRRLDHHGWQEFILSSDRSIGSVVFVHGGPSNSFRLNERAPLIALAGAGYAVRAVNYTDRDPPPVGAAASKQAAQAELQIEGAWVSEYKASRKPPTLLVESFGFQMIGRLLGRSEPLTIWAISPVLSAPGWLEWQKERGADEGVPWANWRRSADLVRSRPDILAKLCHRTAPTKLIVLASVADTTVDPGGAALLKALHDCPRVQLEYREAPGIAHATDELYLDLLRREASPTIGPISISVAAEK